MSEFDLKSPSVRILECAECDEPVSGTPVERRVELTCEACGHVESRELTRTKGEDPDDLQLDLNAPIADVPEKATLATVREHYLLMKRSLAEGVEDDARADVEFRLVWLAAKLAVHQIAGRDYLHARAVLEATFEAVTIPAYRGLVAARLARLAAMSNAQDLGGKWLALAPSADVPEVRSDLRAAEAMLAQKRKDYAAVLKVLGDDELVGPSRWLADALRVDAHEKLGDMRRATQLWREGIRGNAIVLTNTAAAYGLAPETRKRVGRGGLVAIPGLVLAVWGMFGVIRSIVAEQGVAPISVGAIVLGLAVAYAGTRL